MSWIRFRRGSQWSPCRHGGRAPAIAVVGALVLLVAAVSPDACVAAPDGPAIPQKKLPPAPPLGLRVVPLDKSARPMAGVDGALSVVRATGTAYESGLRVGDVIVEVNGKSVSTPNAFWDDVAAGQWQPTLKVLRNGMPLTVRVATPPPPR